MHKEPSKTAGLCLPSTWRFAALGRISRAPFGGLGAMLVLCWPAAVMACALPPSIILTLPTGYFIWAGGLSVAFTVILALMTRWVPRFAALALADIAPDAGRMRRWSALTTGLSWAGFVLMLALIAIGLFGPRDPLHNLMTLVFWTVVWIGVPLLSLLCGNIWLALNPWRGPVRLLRGWLGWHGGIGLERLGCWPAVLGFAGFSWFQIVSLYPDDPTLLAQLAAGYWLVIFVLAVLQGEAWLQRGEFLTVFFAMVARLSPLWLEPSPAGWRLCLGWPGTQLLRMPALGTAELAFVTLVLAALGFDGLNETFWWQGLIGENPLEPTGRSAVMGLNTLGLMASWVLTIVLFAATIAFCGRLRAAPLQAGPFALSLLAIAAGYHLSHYLVMLLTAGQYTLEALNDPFGRGEAWLGLPAHFTSMGFLSDPTTMRLIYAAQFAAVLGAHLLAVVVGLRLVNPLATGSAKRKDDILAHLPMTALMVAYTVFGLWLLSTARSG